LEQDSYEETNTVTTLSSTEIVGGTYTYTRTTATTATLTYVVFSEEPGYSETETATVLLKFTSPSGGTFTSFGSYEGSSAGNLFEGTFTNAGIFFYAPSP
jgi:hypothetical protein